MFESFSNSDHWSEDDKVVWFQRNLNEICQKFEVNQIPPLGIVGIGIMNLVEKSYKVKPVKGCY
jgi:hypothetical protein